MMAIDWSTRKGDTVVCYCKNVNKQQIVDAIADGSRSLKDIQKATQACTGGDCKELNPSGKCCSPDINALIEIYTEGANKTEDCCAGKDQDREATLARPRRIGLWAATVAIISAILSSACCWLPLLLIFFGMSAAGISGFFDAYRLHFLGATALLLATGFYFTYFRKEKCEPGSACAVPNPKLVRFNKVMLWIATAVILLFALFPNYFALLASAGDSDAQVTVNVDENRIVRLQITGMTCQACAVHLRKALSQVADVSSATVSYKEKTASLTVSPGTEIPREAILNAISRTGYTGSFADETDEPTKDREMTP